MQCVKPFRIFPKGKAQGLLLTKYPLGLEVPCGKCIACRIAKRKEWTIRMTHELEAHDDSIFITLTYDDIHIPAFSSLLKSDLQKFFKRLRKKLGKRKIRYFACGEYGDKTDRPHYHSIVFGMSLSNDDKKLIESSWTKGLVHFGLAEPNSIQYVAKYIVKKFSGDLAEAEYTLRNREPVFRLLSLGIGKDYADKNSEVLQANLFVRYKGKEMSIPRYYIKRLGIDSEALRNKALTLDSEVVAHHTGITATADDYYIYHKPDEVRSYKESLDKSKAQHERNLYARIKLKKSKI